MVSCEHSCNGERSDEVIVVEQIDFKIYKHNKNHSRVVMLHRNLPSVLWRWWLGGRKGIRPVKTEWWGAGMVNCLERDADLHMAQLMPLPLTISCFKLVLSFWYRLTQVVPEKRAIKWVCVCYTQISDNKEADVEIMPSYQGPDFHNFFKWS